MDNMNIWHSYWTLLYNGFHNDLSIALNGEVYPELIGMNFPEKFVELWGEWYVNPSMRYKFMKRFDNLLKKMLPESPSDDGSSELVQDSVSFKRCEEPRAFAARRVLEVAQDFKQNRQAYFNIGWGQKGSSDL